MRLLIHAVALAFALGGLVSGAAQAGEDGCEYGSAVKKNDFETPPPASAAPSASETKG